MSEITPADGGAPDPAPGGEGESGSGFGGNAGNDNQIQALTRKLRKFEQAEAARLKAEDEKKTAELSEVEQLRKKLADAEAERSNLANQHKLTQVQFRFEQAAAKAGVVDAAAAWKLADTSGLDLDERGNVPGLDAALKALQKSSPYLFGAAAPPVSSGGGNPAGGQTAPKYDPRTISQMSKDEWVKFDADVRAGKIKLGTGG